MAGSGRAVNQPQFVPLVVLAACAAFTARGHHNSFLTRVFESAGGTGVDVTRRTAQGWVRPRFDRCTDPFGLGFELGIE